METGAAKWNPQSPARMETQGGGDLLEEAMGKTDGDRADCGGAIGAEGEQIKPNNPEGDNPQRWNWRAEAELEGGQSQMEP